MARQIISGPGGSQDQGGGVLNGIVNNLPTIGAIGMGIPGAIFGGIPGGVLATGAGGVTGKSLQNIIRYFQGQKQTPVGNLTSALKEGAVQAPFGALGPEGDIGAQAATRVFGEGVVPKALGQIVGRYVGGQGAGTVSALAGGQKPGEALKTGAQVGGINAIFPMVTGAIGSGLQKIFGKSGEIIDNIAQKYVGQSAAKEPIVRMNLDYTDPLKSATKLEDAAQKIYAPLQAALKSKTASFGDFLNSITEGGTKMLSKDSKITGLVNDVTNYIERNTTGDLGKISSQIQSLQKLINEGVNIEGSKAYQSILDEANKIKVPGDVINGAKMIIGGAGEDAAPMYANARKFIEDMIGNDVPTAEINKNYHALVDAASTIHKNFDKATSKLELEKPLSWMDRIFVGAMGMGANSLLTGTTSPGGMYNMASGALPPLIGQMILHEARKYPERAVPYSQLLQVLESGAGPLMDILKQASLRAPGAQANPGQQ